MARDKGKGVASSSHSRGTTIPEHPLVQTISPDQKKEFLRLMKTPLFATRFLCTIWMRFLDLDNVLQELFEGTGFGFLYGMAELTYPSLTLEFLSSFNYNFEDERVAFRLCNNSYDLSLREFGNLFGFARGGLDRAPDSFDYRFLWGRMCREEPRRVSSLRINAIEHPALRFWFRTLGGTIFGRSEPGNTNKHEMELLGSYLNVQRLAHFRLDLAHYVATHFARVAKGTVSTIEIGGIITYIAKKLEGCDLTRYTPIDAVAPLIDRAYVTKSLKWSNKTNNHLWKITGGRWLHLPCPYLPDLIRLPPAGENELPFFPSYLVDAPPADQGDRGHIDGMDEDQAPPGYEPSPPMPSPPMMPPSAPAYSGPFEPQPPYTQPFYSGTADTQWRIDFQLSMYPTYHDHVLQGRVPRDGPHPSYYTGPEGQYGGYPGRIFLNAGIPPDHRVPNFWSSQSGQGSGGQGNNDDDDGDDDDDGGDDDDDNEE